MPRPVQPPRPVRIRLRHLHPLCLAQLARAPGSGYAVRKTLAALPLFAKAAPDAPGIYRILQGFERREWVRGQPCLSKAGRARREYTLTPAGCAALKGWRQELLRARKEIDAVLALLRKGRK